MIQAWNSEQESKGTRNVGSRQYDGDLQYSGRRYEDQDLDEGFAGLWAGIAGFGVGVLAMYFLDPDRGGRRRALITDKVASAGRRVPDAARVTAQDISNRAQGVWAEATRLFSSDDASDQVIEARVRAKLGRVVSHPHAIHARSNAGKVTLDGVVLERELPELVKAVVGVRGVKSVDVRLKEYESSEGVPSLQGGRPRQSRTEFLQQNWSPAARLTAGAAGTAALAYGLKKRDAVGLGLSAAGAALLARSATNIEFQRLFGFGGGRTAITIDKSINVDAPIDVVYALWLNFENFPQFMTNVLEVTNIDDRVSRWKVAGPAGVPIEWDAEVTRVVPNEMIAWKSVEGSTVANAGYVLFEANDQGGTEVTVRISYNPPAGAVGHAIAKAFGADPKSELDGDLLRMKTLLETGKTPHDAAEHTFGSDREGRVH